MIEFDPLMSEKPPTYQMSSPNGQFSGGVYLIKLMHVAWDEWGDFWKRSKGDLINGCCVYACALMLLYDTCRGRESYKSHVVGYC